MCELLGMAFNLPVRPQISFQGFRKRGEANPDGWGLALYPDTSAQVFKEPIQAGKSSLSAFVKDYPRIKSHLFLAHVRFASCGSLKHQNTHPFRRELCGNVYTFAHNGTLTLSNLERDRFKPLGDTDSEHLFCQLLTKMDQQNRQVEAGNLDWFAEQFQHYNKHGDLNCLFSDGNYLLCYHDANGYNGLQFVQRQPPYGQICLKDQDWTVNLAEEKRPDQTGYLIATKPLTDEPWHSFKPGELIVFRRGHMIYSNRRDIAQYHSFSETEIRVLDVLLHSPHRVALTTIVKKTGRSMEAIRTSIKSLLDRNYIQQDSRDTVAWTHNDATFYTKEEERDEIKQILANHER